MLKYLKTNVAGGVWFFQVKRSKKTGQWHPHIHCVLDAGYMAQSHLSDLWLKVTKTSSVIDIRAIKDKEKTADYVSRYASRPAPLSDYNETDQRDIFSAMHGLRLCGKWGTAKYLSLSIPSVSDGSDWEKICRYEEAVKQYETNPACKMVIDCWRNQKPAPDYLFVASPYKNDPRYIPENIRNLEIDELFKEPP